MSGPRSMTTGSVMMTRRVRSGVLTIKITVFWHVTSCNLIDECFRIAVASASMFWAMPWRWRRWCLLNNGADLLIETCSRGVLSLLGNVSPCGRGHYRMGIVARQATIGRTGFSIGAVRCYIRKVRPEQSSVARVQSVRAVWVLVELQQQWVSIQLVASHIRRVPDVSTEDRSRGLQLDQWAIGQEAIETVNYKNIRAQKDIPIA
jgi:hypothetical protein